MRLPFSKLRILAMAVLAGATLEVSARVDDWVTHGAPLFEPYDIERIYSYDELGKRGRPHASYLKWRLNSLGFHGPELEPDRLSIVVLGASESFGLYEEEDGEYPRQLERELNDDLGDRAVQVVNAAYPGLSVGASLIRLPEVLEQVRPRIAVIYPTLASYISPPREWRLSPRPPTGLLSHIRLAGRLRELVKELLPERLVNVWRRRAIEKALGGKPPLARIRPESVTRFRCDVERMLEILARHEVVPVLVTHATRFGQAVAPEERWLLVAWRRFYPELDEEGFLDMERRLNDVLRQLAKERGLPLVDAARRMPSGPRYFAEFVHFTDEGAERMAELISAELEPVVERELTRPDGPRHVRGGAGGSPNAAPDGSDRPSKRG